MIYLIRAAAVLRAAAVRHDSRFHWPFRRFNTQQYKTAIRARPHRAPAAQTASSRKVEAFCCFTDHLSSVFSSSADLKLSQIHPPANVSLA